MKMNSYWDVVLKRPSFDLHFLKYLINIKKAIVLGTKLFQSLKKGVFFY